MDGTLIYGRPKDVNRNIWSGNNMLHTMFWVHLMPCSNIIILIRNFTAMLLDWFSHWRILRWKSLIDRNGSSTPMIRQSISSENIYNSYIEARC